MRVVLVTSLAQGGPIEQALVLAGGLVARGVQVRAVCATEGIAARFTQAGADAAVLSLRRSFDPSGAARIRRFAAGCDVVHAQDRRSGLWVRLAPRPVGRGLLLYTVHGLPGDYLPPPAGPSRPGPRAVLAYRGLEAFLCRRADAVIVASHALARLLSERLGFPAARMHVIPNGVKPMPRVDGGGDLIGSVSLLEPVKGLEVFLRAAARLAQERPALRFALFGAGSEARRLSLLAERLGISDRVKQPGYVPVREALPQLRILVSSSYMENCPMSILQAMAAGVPVVATAVGGVPEILSADTAQLVGPGDDAALARAVARLVDEPQLASTQSEAARRRIEERFTGERNAEATIALYERLLARRPGDAPHDRRHRSIRETRARDGA